MNTNNKPANYQLINYLAALQGGPLDQRTEKKISLINASANYAALDLLKSLEVARLVFLQSCHKEKKKKRKKRSHLWELWEEQFGSCEIIIPNRVNVSGNICAYLYVRDTSVQCQNQTFIYSHHRNIMTALPFQPKHKNNNVCSGNLWNDWNITSALHFWSGLVFKNDFFNTDCASCARQRMRIDTASSYVVQFNKWLNKCNLTYLNKKALLATGQDLSWIKHEPIPPPP